jgi:hypothetical protein
MPAGLLGFRMPSSMGGDVSTLQVRLSLLLRDTPTLTP